MICNLSVFYQFVWLDFYKNWSLRTEYFISTAWSQRIVWCLCTISEWNENPMKWMCWDTRSQNRAVIECFQWCCCCSGLSASSEARTHAVVYKALKWTLENTTRVRVVFLFAIYCFIVNKTEFKARDEVLPSEAFSKRTHAGLDTDIVVSMLRNVAGKCEI